MIVPSCLKAMILLMLPAGRDEARRSMADTAAKASQTAQEGRPEPVPEPVVGEPAPAPGA